MKRSLQTLSNVARTRAAAATTSSSSSSARVVSQMPKFGLRSLATVADLQVAKDLDIKTHETVHVAPAEDMLGFEVSQSASQDKLGSTNVGRPIYLDAQATTPTDPRVLDAMLPYMTNQYGNPHSKTHAYGWETEKAVEQGRKVSPVQSQSSSRVSWSSWYLASTRC